MEIRIIITAIAGNCGASSSTIIPQNWTGIVRSNPVTKIVLTNSSNDKLNENRIVAIIPGLIIGIITLKKILNGDDYEIPNNPELCNISTLSNVANELYNIALNGSNQKTYYTGNDVIFSLETYFKLIHEIINNKKIISDKNSIDESNMLNCEVLNKFESVREIDKSNVETKIKNLVGSLEVKWKR